MPLLPQNGTLGTQRAAHLLRRATFGGTKQEIDAFATLNAGTAISQLFQQSPQPAPPIDPDLGQSWIGTAPLEDEDDGPRVGYFLGWFFGRMLGNDGLPLQEIVREKITLFFHTYFTTMRTKVDNSRALYYQNALFRAFALDSTDDPLGPRDFRTLVKKVSLDNAMVKFLDSDRNVKGSPNENYAREMLELYTIGRGLEGTLPETSEPGDYIHYKEQDVRAAANVLTGYDFDRQFTNLDPETGLPKATIKGGIQGTRHETDDSLKVFSDRFGNRTITQDPTLLLNGLPTAESMEDELNQLIDMIFEQEETARHLCRKVYRFYVHYEITEAIEADIITDMTQRFITSGFRLQPVLEALLGSTHFFDAFNGVDDDKFGAIIKSPLDLFCGTLRFFELQIPAYSTATTEFYMATGELLRAMELQGMSLYEPIEVAGYPAYHQYPQYNRNWITTNYLVQRYDFVRQLLNNDNMLYLDIRYFIQQHFQANAGDARQLILSILPYVFPMSQDLDFGGGTSQLTGERLNYFLYAFLESNQYNEAEWTSLYADPATNYLEIETLLTSLINSILQTPEYQLF